MNGKTIRKAEKVYEGIEDEEEQECEICSGEIPDGEGIEAEFCEALFCSDRCLDKCREENEDNPDCEQCLESASDDDEEDEGVSCPECGADITDVVEELLEEDDE